MMFKELTTNTNEFSMCFNDDSTFEIQAKKWRKLLSSFFHKCFKKVRISNNPKKKKTKLGELLLRRNILKKKEQLSEKDEEEINTLEEIIAQECEDENRKKVKENFNELCENDGNVNHPGI